MDGVWAPRLGAWLNHPVNVNFKFWLSKVNVTISWLGQGPYWWYLASTSSPWFSRPRNALVVVQATCRLLCPRRWARRWRNSRAFWSAGRRLSSGGRWATGRRPRPTGGSRPTQRCDACNWNTIEVLLFKVTFYTSPKGVTDGFEMWPTPNLASLRFLNRLTIAKTSIPIFPILISAKKKKKTGNQSSVDSAALP
jgi:hypothetical protein